MPRYKLTIEYDGAPFRGWQRQAEGPSVQGTLEAALAALNPGQPAVAGAGRTDAGVHATAQVAHADLSREWADRVISRGQELGVIRTDVPRAFLIEIAMAVGEAGDRWFLEHFEDYDDVDFEREADRQIDVFKRILEPREES